MRTLHLLCNAHLDPVWLWQRQEGIAEAVSTFRVAAKFCEEYDGFVFNHNEAVLYEWVEEYEPDLFVRIQKLVKEKKWHIMGGWYLQPDCIMPSGESFIRQIEVGNRYFMEKFGVKPTTAINFDPFGHTRGLVQILAKWGYDSYVFMRPYHFVPEHDFIWKGYDGSEVIGHCIFSGYNTNKGKVIQRLEEALTDEANPTKLMLWGIGNHGGGPSKVDMDALIAYEKEHSDIKLIHSWCENYFAGVDRTSLRCVESSIVHCMVGCYTTMVRIKQKHRALENELGLCEKLLALSGVEYDQTELERAEKALLFNEFHDVLPGTLIKKAEEDALRGMDYGREILSRYCAKAFFKLCEGQKEGKPGEIPVLVYNPHPYPIETVVEVEFQLEDQNWTQNQVTLVKVRDEKGCYLPAQNEKEDCTFSLDWRKRVAFRATLKPMQMNRFDCELHRENMVRRPIEACEGNGSHFIVKTELLEVHINKRTGLLDKYRVEGRDYLKEGSASIQVYADNEDPWAMNVDGFYNRMAAFELADKEAANAFNGFPGSVHENVRVIENGPVQCKLQAVMKYSKSWAVVTYTIPKQGKYVDIKIKMLSNDANKMYKLAFHTALEDAPFWGQTAFGREVLLKEEKEVNFQKWCAFKAADAGFAILNRGTYGGSAKKNTMYISLMRTPVYSTHPIENRPLIDSDRNHEHIDMGEREFEYRLTCECDYLDADSEMYNQLPYVLSFFPSGTGLRSEREILLSSRQFVLSSLKRIENDLQIRVFHSADKEEQCTLSVDGHSFDIVCGPFEIKTFLYNGVNLSEFEVI